MNVKSMSKTMNSSYLSFMILIKNIIKTELDMPLEKKNLKIKGV